MGEVHTSYNINQTSQMVALRRELEKYNCVYVKNKKKIYFNFDQITTFL